MSDFRPEVLSWTALLGRWIDYARASLALPDDARGSRWKQSVPPVINLQAVRFALDDLTTLEVNDQPLAVDRAELLVTEAHDELMSIWESIARPESLEEIIGDARAAIDTARMIVDGWELTWPGPDSMIMPIVDLPDAAQTLLVMQPGTIVMPDEPVAFGRCCEPIEVPGCRVNSRQSPRQVYRQIDDNGAITGDYIAPIDDELPPGLPMLVPCFADGALLGHFTMEADEWLARQRAALGEHATIPTRFAAP